MQVLRLTPELRTFLHIELIGILLKSWIYPHKGKAFAGFKRQGAAREQRAGHRTEGHHGGS